MMSEEKQVKEKVMEKMKEKENKPANESLVQSMETKTTNLEKVLDIGKESNSEISQTNNEINDVVCDRNDNNNNDDQEEKKEKEKKEEGQESLDQKVYDSNDNHISSNMDKLEDEPISWSTIHELEKQYYETYVQLTHKLDHLVYLQKLKSLTSTPVEKLAPKVKQIQDELMVHSSLQDLFEFLHTANYVTKTDDLLNRYLMMINPIQKALHYADLNTSEAKILEFMDELYNENNPKGTFSVSGNEKKSLTMRVQEIYNRIGSQASKENAIKKYEEVRVQKQEIRDLVQEIKNVKLESSGLRPKYDALVSGEQGGLVQTHVKNVKQLVVKWRRSELLSHLLVLLITNLPYSWYDDEAEKNHEGVNVNGEMSGDEYGGELVRMIVKDLPEIKEKLCLNQLIVNVDTVEELSLQELVRLKFTES